MQVLPRLVKVNRRALEVRTPGPRFAEARRFLIARCDRVGDVVLTLPAVAAIRAAYPGAHLALMVRPGVAPLARMVEGVDAVVEAPAQRGALLGALLDARPDVAICVSRGATLALAVARARVPHRVGTGFRWYAPLFGRRVAERRRAGKRHEAEYALSFAHRSGAPTGTPQFPLRVPDHAEESTRSWLERNGVDRKTFVLLHPGSGRSCPPWPVEHWIELVSHLTVAGRPVVISVGPEDADVAAALDAAPDSVRNLPRFTGGLQELAALARRASAAVSNSTGPLHLAAAFDTPTLGFYPPWPSCGAQRWGPYSERGWALVADTPDIRRWSRAARRRHAHELMRGISSQLAMRCTLDLAAGRPLTVEEADSADS